VALRGGDVAAVELDAEHRHVQVPQPLRLITTLARLRPRIDGQHRLARPLGPLARQCEVPTRHGLLDVEQLQPG